MTSWETTHAALETTLYHQFSLSKWQRSTFHRRGHGGHSSGADGHWTVMLLLLSEHGPWTIPPAPSAPNFADLQICNLTRQLYRNPKTVSILTT